MDGFKLKGSYQMQLDKPKEILYCFRTVNISNPQGIVLVYRLNLEILSKISMKFWDVQILKGRKNQTGENQS